MRIWILSLLMLAGCAPGEVNLAVDLRTDLGVGTELTATRVDLVDADGITLESVMMTVDRDFDQSGFRIAELSVRPGTTRLIATLSGPELDGERRLVVDVRGATVATIVFPRSCVSISCSGGETCIDGRCGPPECSPETTEFCLEPICAVDADCGAPAVSCGRSACDSTAGCITIPDDALCDASEICDPGLGCVPDPTGCEAMAEVCNGLDDDCDAFVDETACTCTRLRRAESTYLLCETALIWAEARDDCRSLGYDLATVEDAEEQAFLWDTANGVLSRDWWLGLNDLTAEGTFVWSDGTALGYENWWPGQPNDGGGGMTEDCVMMSPDVGEWRDGNCLEWMFPYVCEVR